MKMFLNPDGTLSSSRLFNVITWICVLVKFMRPDIFGELDSSVAVALLGASNAAYAARAYQQGRFGSADPKGKVA